MKFETLVEKVRNPLRKKSLENRPTNLQQAREDAEQWKDYILRGNLTDPSDLRIRNTYLNYSKNFPQRAEAWLDQQAQEYVKYQLKVKSEGKRKIYSKFGVNVFLDDHVDPDFSKSPSNMEILKKSVDEMIQYINELLPNRKPEIVITNRHTNPVFKHSSVDAAALALRGIIFVDQEYVSPKVFIHEYAHYVAHTIPSQSEPMLMRVYNNMLDSYWKRAKVKRQNLDPQDRNNVEEQENAKKWRMKIAKKLGYPDEYGIRNFEEFFAVLIENWKKMPANSVTYKFKSDVKSILSRF